MTDHSNPSVFPLVKSFQFFMRRSWLAPASTIIFSFFLWWRCYTISPSTSTSLNNPPIWYHHLLVQAIPHSFVFRGACLKQNWNVGSKEVAQRNPRITILSLNNNLHYWSVMLSWITIHHHWIIYTTTTTTTSLSSSKWHKVGAGVVLPTTIITFSSASSKR